MTLIEHWENLAEREKVILISGGIFALALLIYLLLMAPFFSSLNEAENQLQTNRQIISWLQPAAEKIKAYNQQGYHAIKPSTAPLLEIINSSLQTHQLNRYVTKIIPLNDKTINIRFDAVPFDNTMDWLTSLWLATNARINQATIMRLNTPGLVSMVLVITKVQP